ncbi:MAG: hypothetical protein RIC29_00620 [Rhodospirillaceae bacterium]
MADHLLLHQAVSQIGHKLGTDWRDIQPDRKDRNYLAWEMSRDVWRHVLHGIKSGHLLAFIESDIGRTPIPRTTWPAIPSTSDIKRKTFASLFESTALSLDYNTSAGTYLDSKNVTHDGFIKIDQQTLQSFKAFFKPEPYAETLSTTWRDIGLKGDLPALALRDLLEEWSKTESDVELKPMRRSIISALEQSPQRLPRRQKWLTPHGVFRSDGYLVTPSHIKTMFQCTGAQDDDLEVHWSGSWIIGREWLRTYCSEDQANRPFPVFWTNPTPSPPILIELKKRPSPLKDRKSSDIEERNKVWLTNAKALRKRHPTWTKSNICRQLAKDDGNDDKQESIRRELHRIDPNWDKKVGQS